MKYLRWGSVAIGIRGSHLLDKLPCRHSEDICKDDQQLTRLAQISFGRLTQHGVSQPANVRSTGDVMQRPFVCRAPSHLCCEPPLLLTEVPSGAHSKGDWLPSIGMIKFDH